MHDRACPRNKIMLACRHRDVGTSNVFLLSAQQNLFITTHARLWYESDDFILIKNLEFVALVLYPQESLGQDAV